MSTRSNHAHPLISATQIEAESLPYYHPQLKNLAQVVQGMNWCKDIHGSFLLRDSSRKTGQLSASVWYKQNGSQSSLKHFTIKCHRNSYYLEEDKFPTIEKLIKFYANNDVPNEEGIVGVRLIFPITDVFVRETGGNILDTMVDPFFATVQSHRRTQENPTPTTYEPLNGPIAPKQTIYNQLLKGTTAKAKHTIPLPPEDSDDETVYSYCDLNNDSLVPVRSKPEVPNRPRPPIPAHAQSTKRLSAGSSSVSSFTGSDSTFDTDDENVLIPTRKSKDKKKKFPLFRKTERKTESQCTRHS